MRTRNNCIQLVAILLLWCAAVFAQTPPPVTTTQVTLPLSVGVPQPPNPGGPPSVVGAGGSATYYYWLVSEFSAGNSGLSGPYAVYNAPNTLSSGNYVFVSWNPVPGASSYDVLRTTSPTSPGGACNCAVVVATSSTSVNDQSNSLNSYTVNSFQPQNFQLSLANEVVGAGSTHLILRRQPGGAQLADLNTVGSGLGDPGANGIVKRISLNNTSLAAASDVTGLFSGCSGALALLFNGTCGSAGGATNQVNGVNLSSQTTLNLQNAANFNGFTLMFSNPSGGTVVPIIGGALGPGGIGTLVAGQNGLANSATTDTTNASNISSGTLAAARVANPLNQNTTGQAGTALALAGSPSQCSGAQFAQGIATNGNANCATPAGSPAGSPFATQFNNTIFGGYGPGITGQTPVSQGSSAPPAFSSAGLPGRAVISGSTDSLACDTGTTTVDRLTTVTYATGGTVAVTVPAANAAGCGSGTGTRNIVFSPVVAAWSGHTASTIVTFTSTSNFCTADGLNAPSCSTSFTLTTGQSARISTPDNTNWLVTKSVQGNGNVFNSSGVGTGYQDITEIAAPANPASGVERLYSDSTAHTLKCLTSSGGNCNPASGGSPGGTLGQGQFNSGSSTFGGGGPLHTVATTGTDRCLAVNSLWPSDLDSRDEAATVTCSSNPFSSTANGTWQFGQTLWQTTAVWNDTNTTGATLLKGSARATSHIQAQSGFPAGTTVASPMIGYGVIDTGSTSMFGKSMEHLWWDANGQPGATGIYDDVGQEQSYKRDILVTGAQVEAIGLGHGKNSIQNGGELIDFYVTSGASNACPNGTSNLTFTITNLSLSGANTTDATTGNVTVTTSTAVNVYRNQVIVIPSSVVGSSGTVFGVAASTTTPGKIWRVTSGGTGVTSFTISVMSSHASDSFSGSVSAQIWNMGVSYWSGGVGGTVTRGAHGGTITMKGCDPAQPPVGMALQAPGTYERIHQEGTFFGKYLGLFRAANNITISGSNDDGGGTTNYIRNSIIIDNLWGNADTITIQNETCLGAGGGVGSPTDIIIDVQNGNKITCSNNPKVKEYDIDGGGFAHALLADCADMTNGWCDDGTSYSLYGSGTKLCSWNDSTGAMTGTGCSGGSGTVTPSPQYQVAIFPTSGTVGTVAGSSGIATDATGQLNVSDSAAETVLTLTGTQPAAANPGVNASALESLTGITGGNALSGNNNGGNGSPWTPPLGAGGNATGTGINGSGGSLSINLPAPGTGGSGTESCYNGLGVAQTGCYGGVNISAAYPNAAFTSNAPALSLTNTTPATGPSNQNGTPFFILGSYAWAGATPANTFEAWSCGATRLQATNAAPVTACNWQLPSNTHGQVTSSATSFGAVQLFSSYDGLGALNGASVASDNGALGIGGPSTGSSSQNGPIYIQGQGTDGTDGWDQYWLNHAGTKVGGIDSNTVSNGLRFHGGQSGVVGTSSNFAGGPFLITGGVSTGSGPGGSVQIGTTPPGISGTGENPTVNVLTIDGTAAQNLTLATGIHSISGITTTAASGVSAGVSAIVGWVSCTQANCASSATTIVTTGATTLYTLMAGVDCTSSVASATAILTVTYTDASTTVQTVTGTTATCTTLGSASAGGIAPMAITVKTGTNIQYSVATANSPQYNARISVKQEGLN